MALTLDFMLVVLHPLAVLHSGVSGWCRYACYYLTRNSLTYTAPVMVSDPSLNMDITQVRSTPASSG